MLFAGVAAAQQDPLDRGGPDSLIMVVTPGDLDVVGGDSQFVAEFWMVNDVDTVIGISHGFEWNIAGVQLDSAVLTAEALSAWDFTPFFYYKNNLDSTNAVRKFQMALTRSFMGTGMLPSASRKQIASYYFTVTALDPGTDSIVFDTTVFSGGTIFQWTGMGTVNYIPTWGPPDILLDVSDVGGNGGSNLPTRFDLQQNYPNPFNPVTKIAYDVPKASHVKIEVYNVLGQAVKTLVDEHQPADRYLIEWDGSSESGAKVASGIYFYRFTADENVIDTRKMMLLK